MGDQPRIVRPHDIDPDHDPDLPTFTAHRWEFVGVTYHDPKVLLLGCHGGSGNCRARAEVPEQALVDLVLAPYLAMIDAADLASRAADDAVGYHGPTDA